MRNLLRIICCVGVLFCTYIYGQTNIGFESTAPGAYTGSTSISGWTLSSRTTPGNCSTSNTWTGGSSECVIVSTPLLSFPYVGNIPNSPLGGSNIAVLNTATPNSSSTKLAQTISVTYSNTLLQVAFAGVWQDGHQCCDQTSFVIQLKDSQGNALACQSYSFAPSGPSCQNGSSGYTISTSGSITAAWSNWQVKYFDLTPFVNSNITIEIVCNDCTYGDHYGSLLFDAQLGGQLIGICTCVGTSTYVGQVNLCPGSSLATIVAPLGYVSYSWTPPPGFPIPSSQSTLSTISFTNAVPGNIYTLTVQNVSGCLYLITYTLTTTTVGIAGIGSSNTCQGGTTGSATVIAAGSGTGYNYSWVNSTSSVVATTSLATGLTAGIYSITVTALGSPGCGTAVTTVTVNTTSPGPINLLKPFCSTEAYLSINSGSNYQWYNSLGAISASLGGTASSLTVTNATNNMIYSLGYLSPYGCRDSIRYTLVATTPGSVGVTYNKLICPGASNGSVVVSMIPAAGSPPATNSFSVFSTGTATPVYTAAVNSSSSYSFSASNLSAGGTYSVTAFDGACKYSTSFSVTGYTFNYTLTPNDSPTLCAGQAIAAGVTFTSPPAITQYSYSWSPSTFLIGTIYPTTIVSPTLSVGTVTTIVYTVVVTPSVANCPLTKTISITAANPAPPIISPVPALCKNSPIYTLSANPPGGIFTQNSAITPGGLLTPSLAVTGTNTFTYAISVGTCVAKSTATCIVNNPPTIGISGNSSICNGQSTTLLASGANNYNWLGFSSGPLLMVNPNSNMNYTVIGTNAITTCTNSAFITVSVFPLPALTTSGDTILCTGEQTTLFVNGANNYVWSNNTFGSSITIAPNVTTTYTVTGTNNPGSCSDSKIITVQVSPCTSLGHFTGTTLVHKIYPSPVSTNLVVDIKNNLTFILNDCVGKIILELCLTPGVNTIDMSAFSNGVYFLTLKNNSGIETVKILKAD
jgi:hypothetical protein